MNSSNLIRACLAVVCFAAGAQAFADGATDRAERARIERERRAAEQGFVERDRECRQHFEVTTCVDAAQRERREALKRLRMQQELLDEAARRERAAQRLESIREKESGADAKQREAMARQQQKALSGADAASGSGSAIAPARAPSTRLPREPATGLPRTTAASAAERANDFAERQRDVEAHRQDLARRNAERAAKGKKAIPLPVPGAVPAPSVGSSQASASGR